jgi:hypothetical protein
VNVPASVVPFYHRFMANTDASVVPAFKAQRPPTPQSKKSLTIIQPPTAAAPRMNKA